MNDLTLKVRQIDDVGVDDSDRSHARRRKIHCRRGAESSGSDDENLSVEKLFLSFYADFL